MKSLLRPLSLALVVASAFATVLTVPASADPYRVTVQLTDGTLESLVLDLPAGTRLEYLWYGVVKPDEPLPGMPVWLEPLPEQEAPTAVPAPAPEGPEAPPPAAELAPSAPGGAPQRRSGSERKLPPPAGDVGAKPQPRPKVEHKRGHRHGRAHRSRLRRPDGAPTRQNPGFIDALPGPSTGGGVPSFTIRKFRVPVFLLPIYQAAGMQYGIRWEVLAAINEIETDYGRNLAVSSAGAVGWMQFMPATWRAYGVDANADGRRDPYNPVDAIFAAARYLKAAGYEQDVRRAIFAYNHADWYVDSVMLRARLIAGVPADLVGSLTGLTEGRFPLYGRARYADDRWERLALQRDPHAPNGIEIYARPGTPAVAVNDGVIRKIGRSRRLGRHVIVQDTYGNRFLYAHLGSVARYQRHPERPTPSMPIKRRIFANPELPAPRRASDQELIARSAHGEKLVRLPRVEEGAKVIGGTILGRVGRTVPGKDAHLYFELRPAGKGSPAIDPKPILDGWKLLEASNVFRPNGRSVLRTRPSLTIGQLLMAPKAQLEKRVLADERIDIYPCGRADVRSGQIDRRVLATLAYLAESGLRPTVTSLKCGHSFYTASGNVSHHSSGNAVDIAKVNGIPILGHQEPGGITFQTVRRLLRLQGTMQPSQVISLLSMGGPSFAMADHADHIHVGFRPLFGDGRPLSRVPLASSLGREQWSDLVERLREIDNPTVRRHPSRYSLRAHRHD